METEAVKEVPVTTGTDAQSPAHEDAVTQEDAPKQIPANKSKPKKRKAKVARDSTAPRQPLSGYIRYLNEQREKLKVENPRLSFTEVTRRLASDWGKLPSDEKQLYLTAADLDKERYIREWSVYKTTDAYKQFKRQQQEQKEAQRGLSTTGGGATTQTPPPAKKAKTTLGTVISENAGTAADNLASFGAVATLPVGASPPISATVVHRPRQSTTPSQPCLVSIGADMNSHSSETDIPIFTEQFLQHNKLREAELRQLRKANTDYEQQNAILQKHIEEMRSATDRVRSDGAGAKARAAALNAHLSALTDALVQALGNVSLPGGPYGATKSNIEQYMDALKTLVTENKTHAAVRQARDIVGRMNLPS